MVVWIVQVEILIAIFSEMKTHISFDAISNCDIKLHFEQFEKIIEELGRSSLLILFFVLLTHRWVKVVQSSFKIKVIFFDLLSGLLNAIDFHIKDLILDFLHEENRRECFFHFIDRDDGVLVIFEFIPVIMCSSLHTSFSSSSSLCLSLFLLFLVFLLEFHDLFPELFLRNITFWTDLTLHLEQLRKEFATLFLCKIFFTKLIYFIVNPVVALSSEVFVMLEVIYVEILLVVIFAEVLMGLADNLVLWRHFLIKQ